MFRAATLAVAVLVLTASPASARLWDLTAFGDFNDDPLYSSWTATVRFRAIQGLDCTGCWENGYSAQPDAVSGRITVYGVAGKTEVDLENPAVAIAWSPGAARFDILGDNASATNLGFVFLPVAIPAPNTPFSLSYHDSGSYGDFQGVVSGGINDPHTDTVTLSAHLPEPTTWAMLLSGFGLCGGLLRARRSPLPA